MTQGQPESSEPNTDPLLSHQISAIPSGTPKQEEGGGGLLGILIGNLDLKFFCKPLSLYAKDRTDFSRVRFVTDGEFVPIVLAFFLGLQHACAALGQIVMPPLVLFFYFTGRGLEGAGDFGQYGLQSAIIIAAVVSLFHCHQVKIPGTQYQIGTGMSAFAGNSLMVAYLFRDLTLRIMQDERVSLSDAYGKVLGTAAVCSLFFIILSLVPRKYAKVLFPPVVTGVIIILVGAEAAKMGIILWGGGRECYAYPTMMNCITNGDVQLPFGSPEYIGLGFFALVLFLVFELIGTAFSRRIIILLSVMIVYAISALLKKDGNRYVTGDFIDGADDAEFLWTTVHKIGFHKSAVLPLIAAYLITYVQATGIITGSLEESGLDVADDEADRRIQGGLITASIGCLFAVLATGMPVMPVPQNNSITSISRVASRFSGLAGVIWLFIFGFFGKVLGVFFMEIPTVVAGGIFTLLAFIVIMSGVKVLKRLHWDRRTNLIVVLSLAFGVAHIIIEPFFNDNIWPKDDNIKEFVETLRYAILTLLKAPYFVGGAIAAILYFALPRNMELDHNQPMLSMPQSSAQVVVTEA